MGGARAGLNAGFWGNREGVATVAVATDISMLNLLEMAEFSPDHAVEKSVASTDSMDVELYCFEPGQVLDMYSDEADEVVVVLQGSIMLLSDGMEQNLGMGQAALVPADTMHGYRNSGSERTVLCHVSAPCF